MRNLILTFTLIFIGSWNSYSQTLLDTDGLNRLDNVYLHSLKRYCNSLDSLKTKIVYVKQEHFIGENWPKKIMTFEIKYLKYDEYKPVIKQNGGKVTIVGICPFDYRNGQFSVGVIPFKATYSRKNVSFGNSGGLSVYYEFDAEKKGLVYKAEKWSGI